MKNKNNSKIAAEQQSVGNDGYAFNQRSLKTKRKKTKIITAVIAVLSVSGIAAVSINSSASAEKDAPQAGYREYSVSKGDITLGTNESGTLSLEREYITLPCNADITELYVKTGSKVQAGDPLLLADPDDIADAMEQYEDKLTEAKLAVTEAENALEQGMIKAQQELNSTLSKGSTAMSEYELYLSETAASKEQAEKELSELRESLAEYEQMLVTYDDNYKILSSYEEKLDTYDNSYSEKEQIYRGYQKTDNANSTELENMRDEYEEYIDSISQQADKIKALKSTYDEAKNAYDKAYTEYEEAKKSYDEAVAANNSDNSSDSEKSVTSAQNKLDSAKASLNTAFEKYNSARTAYSGYYVNLDNEISEKTAEYEDKIANLEKKLKSGQKISSAFKAELDELSEEISLYRKEYEDFREDYTEIYGNEDKDSIENNIERLNTEISSAQLKISSTQLTADSDRLNALGQAEAAQAQASSAEDVYNSTVNSLEISLKTRQREYDALMEEYEEFCLTAGNDGIILSPVSGIVSSVSVSEGDTASENMNIITIMNSSEITLSTSVSEEDISSVSVGQECSVSLTAFEGKTLAAEVDTVSAEPARSSGSVSYTVTVKLTDENNLDVREGMSGEITFLEHQVTDVLYTNIGAVTFRDGISYVKMYDDNGAVIEKEVVTGFTDGRYVEIISGLSAGDRVLAEITLSGGKD